MPIYEYRCSSCGSEHEVLQKLSEPRLVTCPNCHKDTLVKLLSAAGFQLKGSGWYVTDFRNGSKPAAKTPEKTEASTDGATAAATAPSATEKAAETKSETPAPAPAPAKPTSTE